MTTTTTTTTDPTVTIESRASGYYDSSYAVNVDGRKAGHVSKSPDHGGRGRWYAQLPSTKPIGFFNTRKAAVDAIVRYHVRAMEQLPAQISQLSFEAAQLLRKIADLSECTIEEAAAAAVEDAYGYGT